MIPILAFDIETVPDVEGLRRVHGVPAELSDESVIEMAQTLRRQATGNDFLQLPLQRVVAIACVLREGGQLKLWSLGRPEDGEAELVRRFFEGVERYTPQLVSWNGGGFDLPVLHYRALVHGVEAARYWEWGEEDRDFRYNNYLSRFHTRHIDLMDVLAAYQPRAWAPLDSVARLLGLPGKAGMDGSQVGEAFRRGEIAAIRNYCEGDAMTTYLLYLRFQRMRGALAAPAYAAELAMAQALVAGREGSPWGELAEALAGGLSG